MIDSSFSAYKARRHFANLDGLRFFCIFLVLWHHAPVTSVPEIALLQRGFLGVDFFFVLSGYLITTLLLREEETHGRFSLRDFYIRRAVRIIPVYYFVVTWVAIYYIILKGEGGYIDQLPFYYLFLSNFLTEHIPTLYPTWSLSVEEQFYLFWPLLLMILPRFLLLPVGVLLVVVNVIGIMAGFGESTLKDELLNFKLHNATYAPMFLGALLACSLNTQKGYSFLARLLGYRLVALALTIMLILCLEILPSDLLGLPNLLIHLIMASILAALIIREDSVGYRFLQNTFIIRFGAVSYGIYLYHLLALDVVRRGLGAFNYDNDWLVLISYSLLSYLVAEISFRTLEAYFQKLRPKTRTKYYA